MKFLLFNVVVAVALVFLFTGDKADFSAAAEHAVRITDGIKAKAYEVLGANRAPVANKPKPAPPVAADTPAARTARAPVRDPAPAAPAPKPAPPVPALPKPAAADPTQPPPHRPVAAAPPAEPRVAALPPEVAQRRAEVLGETAAAGPGIPRFMSGSDRRRDLMLLSEEMELFSAGAIGR